MFVTSISRQMEYLILTLTALEISNNACYYQFMYFKALVFVPCCVNLCFVVSCY